MGDYEAVKRLYKEIYGIDEDIIDLLADYDIMYNCVVGLSNTEISDLLGIDIEIIKNVLENRFNFIGWKYSLDFSPLYIYNKVNGIWELYYETVSKILRVSDELVKLSYRLCKDFINYEKFLDERYG